MQCPNNNCGRTWNEGDAAFPLCITNPCPLRAYKDRWTSEEDKKNQFNSSGSAVDKNFTLHSSLIKTSISSLCDAYDADTKPYDMKGSKSATTTVTLRDNTQLKFRTKNQMHSEMVAIEYMLEIGEWIVDLGVIVWCDGTPITAEQFSTTEPHCGFCTFFLSALWLPLTTPTYGRFQLASRLSYQLPIELEINPCFMARILDRGSYCGFHMIKKILNGFVPLKPSNWVLNIKDLALVDDNSYIGESSGRHIISWDDLVNQSKREVLYAIWKLIYDLLFQHIGELK